MLDDGSLRPEASGLTREVWETFTRVTTRDVAADVMIEFRVGDSPDSDTYAYVQQGRRGSEWILAANLATSDDRSQLIATMIHEYAHILTLNTGEVSSKSGDCQTLEVMEGCALETSLLWAFEKRFWAAYDTSAPEPDNVDGDVAWDFYLEHEDDFVSDYAATSVVEDFAESFMTWVIEDGERGNSVAAEKLAFFDTYPDLVDMRDRIRVEFADDLGL